VPDHFFFAYTTEWHEIVDAGLIEDLRRSVRDKPDHPDQIRLKRLDQYLHDGPKRLEVQLWISADGIGRQCRDVKYGSMGFTDMALGENAAWMMSERGLTITPSQPSSAPPERDAASGAAGALAEASDFLYGPLRFYAASIANLRDLRMEGDSWILTFSVEQRMCEIRGIWNEQSQTALAMSAKFVGDTQAISGVTEITAHEWKFHPGLDRWIPSTVQLSLAGAGRFCANILRSASRVTRDEVAELCRVPSLNNPDPIRGAPPANAISDFRVGLVPSGVSTKFTASHGAVWSRRWFQWLAIGAAGLLLAAIVVNRVVRSRVHA
jgi:hypothetical protein